VAALAVLAACGCPPPAAAPTNRTRVAPAREQTPAPLFLKGQLHLHSDASGDSTTPPDDVVRWYAEADFDFIVFTDHNRITEHAGIDGMLVFPGIELTQNLERCDPPPEQGLSCLLHVNGLFVDPALAQSLADLPRPDSVARKDLYLHALQTTDALGGLAMLDHPNFHYAADGPLLTALAAEGLRFFEVANEAVDSSNDGDASHPSTEKLWDQVLTAGHELYGIATDDAHHYYDAAATRARGEVAHVGDRGFVMVKADRDATSIRAALQRGDFYASNGLLLRDVRLDGSVLRIEADENVTTTFIGDSGRILATARGKTAALDITKAGSAYVRARVVGPRRTIAWIQPHWP
jgi:hypothetical protein